MKASSQSAEAAQVAAVYRVMNSIETNIGGGEGVEGLYGSIKGSGMHKILESMRERCGMGAKSHIVDIGAGLGRPLIHALISGHASSASGIELDSVKCQKADTFLRLSLRQLQQRGIASSDLVAPIIECAPIEAVRTLNPATHAYSFWEGVPFEARLAFGRLFAASSTLQAVTVVQRSMRDADPAFLMEDWYGFGGLVLVDSFPVSMSGSGRNFMAYVFNKASHAAKLQAAPTAQATDAHEAIIDTPEASEGEVPALLETPSTSPLPLVSSEESLETLVASRKKPKNGALKVSKAVRMQTSGVAKSAVLGGKSGVQKGLNAYELRQTRGGSGVGSKVKGVVAVDGRISSRTGLLN